MSLFAIFASFVPSRFKQFPSFVRVPSLAAMHRFATIPVVSD